MTSASHGMPAYAQVFASNTLYGLVTEAHMSVNNLHRLLLDSVAAGARTRDHWVICPMP